MGDLDGGCAASTGGIFDNYAMEQASTRSSPWTSRPRVPAPPKELLYGVPLHKKIKRRACFDRVPRREEATAANAPRPAIPPEQIDEISEPFRNSVHQSARREPHRRGLRATFGSAIGRGLESCGDTIVYIAPKPCSTR